MKRNKRLLMIALPLLAILFVLAFYEYVYIGVDSELSIIRDEQDLKLKTLSKYLSLIAQRPEFEKELAALKEQVKAQSVRLVPGEPISIASANMQAMVKGIIIERGGTIASERIGKPDDLEKAATQQSSTVPAQKNQTQKKGPQPPEPPKLQVLIVSMDATVPDIAALSDILYSIETRTPDLVVKELDVRVKNFRDPRELMVRIDVIGLYEGK